MLTTPENHHQHQSDADERAEGCANERLRLVFNTTLLHLPALFGENQQCKWAYQLKMKSDLPMSFTLVSSKVRVSEPIRIIASSPIA